MQGLLHEFLAPKASEAGVLFASGHSGRRYSEDFLRRIRLDSRAVRASEDAYVDDFFDSVPNLGAGFLKAHAPRAFLDVNRAETDLDPAVIAGITASGANPRVLHGLGVIPRVVAPGVPIYDRKIERSEAMARIEGLWRPYHATLRAQMEMARARLGAAILFDCHSMPSRASPQADIVLGDNYGRACSPNITAGAAQAFEAQGFRVACNAPFAGGYTTKCYGQPMKGWHALQIEIRRDLYLDEASVSRSAQFEAVRQRILRAVEVLVRLRP